MKLLRAAGRADVEARATRMPGVDNLKVALVVAVVVAHATMAWTGQSGAWALTEPPVREPMLTLLSLAALVGVMFAMATFFYIAGVFTPASLGRKGTERYLLDRTLRLGVPLLAYLLLLSPVVEYVDARDEGDWNQGLLAFIPHSWLHPTPGPLWFLEVLWLFSVLYALWRAAHPATPPTTAPHPARLLVLTGVLVATASFGIRLVLPFGQEIGTTDLYLAQAPAWIAGFTLGVLAAERGWAADRLAPATSRWLFRVAWTAAAGTATVVSVTVGAFGGTIDAFFGGMTWQSLTLCALQGALVVTMPLWLVDVFSRRLRRQGRLLREMSRAAFAAFLIHQVVLVGAVLATRAAPWPPEADYLTAAGLAIAGSFGLGALLLRIPGVSRIV